MTRVPPVSLWPDPHALGPMTDLYELTMMAGYFASGMATESATFELFVRKMPHHRAYLVFAGLEQAIGDLLELAFSPEQIDSLRQLPAFRHVDDEVLNSLAKTRFEGDLWAVPEGTVVFSGETLVRVTCALAPGAVVGDTVTRVAGLPDAGRFQGRTCGRRRGREVALRVRCASGSWAHGRLARGSGGLCRRFHGNEPRRGCAPARHSRERHDGTFLGPVVRD